jgi:predicted ferric reductase
MTTQRVSRVAVVPRRPRFGWADVLGPLAIATVVVAVFIWLFQEGLASLTTVDSALGSLASLTGLLASDLMVLQVVMLARIPQVELAWGHDLLARRHKLMAYWSFWLMMAHILLFTIQRLLRAGGWDNATIYELYISESWLLAATVGTIMLIGVVITSIRAARRRLRYESWHLLHLYSYLGLALALPHQIADGADFHRTFAIVYWWTLYAVGLGLILWCRIGIPVWRSLHHQVRVTSVTPEGPGVVSVYMRGRYLDRLRTKSGQFFIWRFRDGPGWTRGTPYTISAAPDDSHLRVTIRAAGPKTARAERLRPGTKVYIEGPYGSMTAQRRTQPRMLLMAAGVGITPLRALLEDTPYEPGEAVLLYRFTDEHDAVLAREIDELARVRGVEVRHLVGPRRHEGSWLPAAGTLSDAEALSQMVPDVADCDIFVCGPAPWMKAVRRAAIAAGAHRAQLHTEDFAW